MMANTIPLHEKIGRIREALDLASDEVVTIGATVFVPVEYDHLEEGWIEIEEDLDPKLIEPKDESLMVDDKPRTRIDL